jgi:plasmid stability protein
MAGEFKLHDGAMVKLLHEQFVTDDLLDRALRIRAAAGPGHRVETEAGNNRPRAAIITDDIPAMLRERKDRNLTRAIDAGRD